MDPVRQGVPSTRGTARRVARIAPFLIVSWTGASMLAASVSGLAWTDLPRIHEVGMSGTGLVIRALIGGLVMGTTSAWLETTVLPQWGRRFPLGVALLLRTLAYALLVFLVITGIMFATAYTILEMRPKELIADPVFIAFRQTGVLARFGLTLVVSSFVINLALQLRRVLGPETLLALLLGRYRRPVREERTFAFLDLKDSTAWAERLGPLAFTDFKNDFFADVAEPVLATGGRIVQYVGDEVMVSWPMHRAEKDAAPLRFFFLVEARVAAHAEQYRQRYGDVPQFKAGIHGGWVVTAEVGDLRRDIVHSGDVVNTAARIEGECRPRGEHLLVSAELADRMPAVPNVTLTPLGETVLRGKSTPVGIVSAVLASPAHAVAEG